MSVHQFQRKTYAAKAFHAAAFEMSGTLDGYVDFVVPERGTYQLSLEEVRSLIAALRDVESDIVLNCQYDADPLLAKK